MKKIVMSVLLALCAGCLSPIRFCMPHGPVGTSRITNDFEVISVTTNSWCCYPTIWMRVEVTKSQFDPTNSKYHWYNWIPITAIWLTTPLDGAVDTLLAPWDLWHYYHSQ